MFAESAISQDVEDRQVTMFSMFVGPTLFTTRAALAKASKIPDSSLRAYAAGTAMPLSVALHLNRFLPAEAMLMLTEPGGVRFASIEAADANWDEIASETAGLTFEICEARKDGKYDHVEKARLKMRARSLMAGLADVVDD